MKSKNVAGLLAIFLGGFGIHKFYLGSNGLGILYLLFFWTFIPGIIGFIEGLILFFTSDDEFNKKYNSEMKKCQFCSESIRKEAIKCRHCGSSLVLGEKEGAQ